MTGKVYRTYSFLGDLPHVGGDPDTLWVFVEELLRSCGVDVVYEEGVFSWDLRSEVLRHGVTCRRSKYRRIQVGSSSSTNPFVQGL
jgi:hypothetical protein